MGPGDLPHTLMLTFIPRFQCLLLCLVGLLELGAASPLQAQAFRLSEQDSALQQRAIEAERRAIFHGTWALSSPERQRIVADLFERHGAGSSIQRDQPGRPLLALGTRILMGADGARIQNDPLVRLADELDVFSAPVDLKAQETPAEGQVINVGVRLLRPFAAAEFPMDELRLSLSWVAAGGELLEAYEGVHGREELNQGLPVALRTPPSASGTWSLLPSLESAGKRVRGWPIPVPLVHDFHGRVERLQAGQRIMGELAHVLKWGRIWVRRSDRLGPGGWLDAMESGQVGGQRFSLDVWLPRPDPKRPTVLLVASPHESAASLLVGPAGEAWIAAAEAHDFHLACVEGSQMVGPDLAKRLEALVAQGAGDRVLLVARGESAVSVNLSLPLAPLPQVVGMVLVNAFGAPNPVHAPWPTLLVGCGGQAARDGEQVTRLGAPPTLLLADSVLLKGFLPWFDERFGH